MNKKIVPFVVPLLVSSFSYASTYSCEVIDYSDYRVEINRESKKAALVDNNAWSVIPESRFSPSGVEYAGNDTYGSPLKIELSFLEITEENGAVSFEVNGRQANAPLRCSYIEPEELSSGI